MDCREIKCESASSAFAELKDPCIGPEILYFFPHCCSVILQNSIILPLTHATRNVDNLKNEEEEEEKKKKMSTLQVANLLVNTF